MIKKKTLVIVLVVLLLASIAFGFAYDFAVGKIERAEHPREYADLVTSAANRYGVPEAMIYAVIKTESSFDPNAVSRSGAMGLMQLMPSTFEDLTNNFLKENLESDNITDPATNIKYGVYYLSWLYSKFGNWETVAAAYNKGIGEVQKWLQNPEYSDDGITLKYIPASETRAYVRKVSDAKETYERLYYK